MTNLVPFPSIYRAVLWSEVNQPLLRALCEVEDGGIPVSLCYTPDDSADRQAVTIVLDSRTMRRMLGADRASAPAGPAHREPASGWRLGTIRRADPGWDTLQRALTERDAPLPASLNWEHYSWRVRVYAPDPDAGECDIVF
jgi:hypothetical protein